MLLCFKDFIRVVSKFVNDVYDACLFTAKKLNEKILQMTYFTYVEYVPVYNQNRVKSYSVCESYLHTKLAPDAMTL